MSDFIARPPAGGAREGGGGPWNGGAPPPVLVFALATAAIIAVTLFLLLGRFGGGGEGQAVPVRDADSAPVGAAAQPERVELDVTLLGSGEGVIQIQPGDIACIKPCKHEFDRGTRVTVTADPASGSTFAGWDDACSATGRCSIVMDADQALGATFDAKPAAPVEPLCDDAATAAEDPACAEEDLGDEELDPGDEPLEPAPAADCADGRDNDRDGLTDSAQDPNCADGNAEGGAAATPGVTPPPPPPAPNDCADGRDNDRDGLTDRAQDPNCVGGRSESG